MNDNDSAMLLSQLSHQAYIQNDMTMQHLFQQAEYTLFSILRPKIYKDGNQWCVLYGDNVQDGICGFGDTPYKAVVDFNNSWNSPIK